MFNIDQIKRIQGSIDYIEENLCEDIKLEDIAETAYLSQFHFHRTFHAVVGETVMDYIRKRRLTRAAEDLIQDKVKVIDVALKYQFGSQEAFTRAFKKQFGVSPREYRKNKIEEKLFSRINVEEIINPKVINRKIKAARNNEVSMRMAA